jgi:hypothetical protein
LIILQLGLERPEIEPEVSEPDSVGEEGAEPDTGTESEN